LIDKNTVDLENVYKNFSNPAYVIEHGNKVTDGKIAKYIVRTKIETKRLGEIPMASSYVEDSGEGKAVLYLLLSKEQLLKVLRTIPSVRAEAGEITPDSRGEYAYHPNEENFEKIVLY